MYGSGAGGPRYMNGRRLFVAVPVPPKGVPQGALYIREWGGGTPLYERRAVIRGGPSAPEGGTPGSAVYPGVGRGNPAIRTAGCS